MDIQLKTYDGLLKKWQRKINLVSESTLEDSQTRHFEDSLQILPSLPKSAKTLYDIGSGAGFPGLVVAVRRPDLTVHLIESNGKKTGFLKTVIRELALENVEVHNRRIEDMVQELAPPDILTARAFAALPKIFDMTYDWAVANPKLRYILLKGKSAREEISEALARYQFDHFSAPSSTQPDSAVLRIESLLKKTP